MPVEILKTYRIYARPYEALVPSVEAYFTVEEDAKKYAKAYSDEGYTTEVHPESVVLVAGRYFVLRNPVDVSESLADRVRKDMLKKASPAEKRLLSGT